MKSKTSQKTKSSKESKRYWLMKSEATCYSIDDLKRDKQTEWDGVRNYQARNYMRDDMQKGDLVLFYYSNADPAGVAGIARVCALSHADTSAFDVNDRHYDPTSDKLNPRWVCVDLCFKKKFKTFITLANIKASTDLKGIVVAQKGSRLSVQPVSQEHFKIIEKMGE